LRDSLTWKQHPARLRGSLLLWTTSDSGTEHQLLFV
jgi:hypothetical protein